MTPRSCRIAVNSWKHVELLHPEAPYKDSWSILLGIQTPMHLPGLSARIVDNLSGGPRAPKLAEEGLVPSKHKNEIPCASSEDELFLLFLLWSVTHEIALFSRLQSARRLLPQNRYTSKLQSSLKIINSSEV